MYTVYDLGVIEKEFHFLLYCILYDELRLPIFENISRWNSLERKLLFWHILFVKPRK